ncbi:hypothetical protein COLO4_24890 [Corchorus olitorius]|uniref:Uncharacterized protein n=1 Tax=Corchorus olitorius TaxID=93759 RepID=A0A1R3I5X3_9ROSI|nr:hypothetical protein COLO4_24890 [Corchorus olitorius]
MAAETPKKQLQSPRKPKQSPNNLKSKSSPPPASISPQTPQSSIPPEPPLRRSSRRSSLSFKLKDDYVNHDKADPKTPRKAPEENGKCSRKSRSNEDSVKTPKTPKSKRNEENKKTPKLGKLGDGMVEVEVTFSPASPEVLENKKRKRGEEKSVVTRSMAAKSPKKKEKKRVYYKKVVYDGGEFEVGDDVYVKRREDASSDDEIPEVEECRVCYKSGRNVMIECDDCLGGFHLKCLKPPLKEVPEGDWVCGFCQARKLGKDVQFPKPPEGKKRIRTLREKLLSSDLWAARIESLWKDVDGSYWFRGRWYMIPEETASGRQPHNLRRELYLTNDFADIEMESIIRHCNVMSPKEYAKANNEGDDVFLCEYEYDIHWHSFKRLAEIDNDEADGEHADSDEDWNSCKEADSDTDEEMEYDEESARNAQNRPPSAHQLAAV